MKIGYNVKVKTSLYNRAYAKNIIDAKTLDISLTADVNESFDATKLKKALDGFTKHADGALFVRVDDPTMIDILEPKAGNTVHNRLNELKRALTDSYAVHIIGTTVPPETKNGYRVFVMGTKFTVTMEGIALLILMHFGLQNVNNQTITINDGNITVTLDNADIPKD